MGLRRKIIQIAIDPESEFSYAELYAVCSDGSLWRLSTAGGSWKLIPDVPQGPLDPTAERTTIKATTRIAE